MVLLKPCSEEEGAGSEPFRVDISCWPPFSLFAKQSYKV